MEDIKDKIQDVSLIRGLNTFLKGILTEEQHEKVKNRVKNYIADMGSDYKPDEEDVYAEATGRGMYRYLNDVTRSSGLHKPRNSETKMIKLK